MVTNVGPRTVFLSWQPPLPEDQNGVIIEYIVRTVDIGNSQTTEDQTTETNSTIRRLIYSQKYNFTVAAMTIIGRGPFSDPVTIISSGRSKCVCFAKVLVKDKLLLCISLYRAFSSYTL